MRRNDALRAEDVIAEAQARFGTACSCGTALIGHDVVLSLLIGHKQAPRCIPCLAAFAAEEPEHLVRRSRAYMARLACYLAGWKHADKQLATLGIARPPYLLAPELESPDADEETNDRSSGPTPSTPLDSWDAGDMGCGDLVLELRIRLAELAPGEILALRATDSGAPGDIPAWCRITKNPLVLNEHPHYWIQRRPPQ